MFLAGTPFLRSRWFCLGGLVAFLICLRNLVWEIQREFPAIELLRTLQKSSGNMFIRAHFLHGGHDLVFADTK